MRAHIRPSNRSMQWSVVALGIAVLWSLAGAQVARAQAAPKQRLTAAQVLDLQKRFQNATVAADTAAIGKLMADDALFVHGNALVQTKAEFLEAATKGKFRFTSFVSKDSKVVFFDGGAMISAVQDISLMPRPGSGEQPLQVQMRVSSVWIAKPAGWQLLLNQGTPIQAPAAVPAAGTPSAPAPSAR